MHDASILVVDDEPEILANVSRNLSLQGFRVATAINGADALRVAQDVQPDLIVLDMMLPGAMSGLDVCRNVRLWSQTPIIVLSALGQERQKVAALDLGADDYLTKPFGMDELMARIRALLRRRQSAPHQEDTQTYATSDLALDFARRIVIKAGDEIKLTPTEYELLRYLALHADRVITHRQLLSAVWGAEYTDETQLLRVHVGHLRRKIEANPARPRIVTTEPGVGYRLHTLD